MTTACVSAASASGQTCLCVFCRGCNVSDCVEGNMNEAAAGQGTPVTAAGCGAPTAQAPAPSPAAQSPGSSVPASAPSPKAQAPAEPARSGRRKTASTADEATAVGPASHPGSEWLSSLRQDDSAGMTSDARRAHSVHTQDLYQALRYVQSVPPMAANLSRRPLSPHLVHLVGPGFMHALMHVLDDTELFWR